MPIIRIMDLRKTKPTEIYDFVCDETSPVGNPFPMTTEEKRDEVCDKYDIYFKTMYEHSNPEFINYMNLMINAYQKYNVIRLFCWCTPKRCHCETIRNYILKVTQEVW